MKDKYEAQADDGKDYLFFTFWSESSAGTKQNMVDAHAEYRKRHNGCDIKIIHTKKVNNDAEYDDMRIRKKTIEETDS